MNLRKNLLLFILIFASSVVLAQDDEKEDGFKIGGAMRFNLLSTNYESGASNLNPQFTWDTWRLNVDGSMGDIDLSFEYRFYPTFGTHFIHHGFLGYEWSDQVYMELGVTQVPFGITTYASHSWWFQGPYYVGLEDDYDMGINFDINPSDKVEISVAYFRQAEPEGPKFGGDVTFGNAGPGRYSYDVVPGNGAYVAADGEIVTTSASLRELDQFNARLAVDVSEGWEVGVSGQVGRIYNSVLDEAKAATAFAAHVVGNFGRFNLKAEYINYNYKAQGDNGQDLDVVQMGAYGYEYFGGDGYTGGVASNSNMYVVGLAYTIPVEFGPISSIQPYVDYTLIDKKEEAFFDTQHLIPGFLISAGPVYTYVDYAMGKNQPWLTESFGKGLGSGVEDPDWNKRFNINIGYYF
ncbi:hypothetical protein [Draconibacterium halophilum]|uniref:Uncharacterized protein n=1 Tax=Draconibacterium halophilum TaxID=2706887 RepID=A0A6C0RCM6_9BACT|nr:hypothetical protein [Draconibacterium halophilum]QIA08244.1 hypothetical protein G0Q07_11200 [Draconibacterium halophilum]